MSENWHIIGRGAIGLLWAHQLVRLKQTVRLVLRPASPSAEPHQGAFTFTDIHGEESNFNVHLSTYTDSSDQQQAINYLVVPLKAYDVLPAIRQIRPLINPSTVIILCHNGMGTIEQVQQMLGPNQPLLFATTTHGAYRKTPQHLIHSGLGETKMGWINPPETSVENDQLSQTLEQILGPVSWHQDINTVLWQKLAINSVINPLTAIHQIKNGDLKQTRFSAQINRLCDEIKRVTDSCGIALDYGDLIHDCYRVINNTANNYSSMNRDIAAGRRTEIDYITGYLMTQAKKHNVRVLEHSHLYRKIKAIEGG